MKSPAAAKLLVLVLLSLSVGFSRAAAPTGEFYAYYSRIESREEFEDYSRTGDYADLVVKLGHPEGRLVFWRGASYLPYWETSQGKWFLDEIVPRHGDGEGRRTDRVNAFSHVALIESSPGRVVVNWRYLPEFAPGNPHPGLDPAQFAEELFAVSPDGKITRSIRQGTARVDAWNDPLNRTTQVLQLAADGVREISRQAPAQSPPAAPTVRNAVRPRSGIQPVCEWRFDDAAGEQALETVSGTRCPVSGPKALWRKGVSGTALQFDGYNTAVALPSAQAPVVAGGSLTLEGWVALGAYPWNWAPLVQQGDEDGYFLGVDSHGYPGFKVKVGGVWEQLSVPSRPPYADTNHLAVFTWHHLAGTYQQSDGMMRLYLNGNEIARRHAGQGGVQTVPAEVRVGKAGIRRVPTEGTHDTLPSEFGLDGLIDEVRVYRVALEPSQVAEAFASLSPGREMVSAPDMTPRHFPVPATNGKFGAVYTHLPYYETWENLFRFGSYPDVVVGFDQLPTKFVFWRGVSFIPMMVNETNQWFTEEFNETGFTREAPGDCEPMSDKACYNSHVRVLENHDARVVVQWRYQLANPDHYWANCDPATGWGDVTDWYFYIYPDGVATVLMHLYTAKLAAWYEWDEQIAVLGEGQHPESIVRRHPVMTLVDPAGHAAPYNWDPEPPKPKYAGNVIQMIHFTGEYSPFAIQDFDGGDVYSGERTWYSVFPSWNHWPTAQANSSGRNSSFPDRAAHCSISHLLWPLRAKRDGKVPFQEKILMEGMAKGNPAALVPLAKSWLRPPALESAAGCRSLGYDAAQRAYVVVATGPVLSFSLAASPDHPLVNPGIVVRNWNVETLAQVEFAGVPQSDWPAVRQGIVRDPNGRPMLVLWLQGTVTAPLKITVRGAKPGETAGTLPPAAWVVSPRPATNTLAISMAAAPLTGVGAEYCFECLAGPGHTSGWIGEAAYTDTEIPPMTKLAYRVKARDAYLAETWWSGVESVQTPAAPVPVRWRLNEGAGTKVRDSAGQYEGIIQGPATWVEGIRGQALHLEGNSQVQIRNAGELRSDRSFTWAAWIRTTQGGAILARAGAGRQWQRGGKVLFVEDGRLRFDVGWVGATGAEQPVNDGAWHHVAVTVDAPGGGGDNVRCYVDGVLGGHGSLEVKTEGESRLPVKIGFCNHDFPQSRSGFVGDLTDVRWYGYALPAEAVRRIAEAKGE